MKKLLLLLTTFSFHMAEKSALAKIEILDAKKLMKATEAQTNSAVDNSSFKGKILKVNFSIENQGQSGIPSMGVIVGDDISNSITLKFSAEHYYLATQFFSAVGSQL